MIGVAEAYKREWKRWKGEEVSDSDDDDDVNASRQSFGNHRRRMIVMISPARQRYDVVGSATVINTTHTHTEISLLIHHCAD